ncbi:MAG: L,D-transpeptidase/peptidoglycan binding protein [Ruminococcus sp.]|nr:L,D-transpeptidase/peptidoglycan binding protein [Ruminococcus sp.]
MSNTHEMSSTAVLDKDEGYKFDSSAVTAAMDRKREAVEAAKVQLAKKKRRAVILIVTAALALLAAVYAGIWSSAKGKFLPNTYIDGIDVSKMTVAKASAALTAEHSPGELKIETRNGEKTIYPADYGCEYNVFGKVQEIYRQVNHFGWIGSYFKDSFYETNAAPVYDSEKLEKLLRRTDWGETETADAYLAHGEDGYYIVPEVKGDKPDIDRLTAYVLRETATGNYDIDLEKSGCYSDPKVLSHELEGRLEELKNGFDYEIIYDFGYTTETLTGADVYEWMTDGGKLDESRVTEYVAELADKYDTFMKPRSFKTTNKGTITMNQVRYSTGQYGWWIDQEKTAEKLLEYIKNGKSVTCEPEYVTLDTGYTYRGFDSGRSAGGDIGDTYVEVDLSAQHMWYYKEGKLEFETDQIVSGKASDPKRKTPEGVYSVYRKDTNYTMVAADGSYTAKCKYFMRISFEGIGFHDYSRSAYGGNIYLTNGSHGCINMKYDEVKQLYETVEWGTPVILYY